MNPAACGVVIACTVLATLTGLTVYALGMWLSRSDGSWEVSW